MKKVIKDKLSCLSINLFNNTQEVLNSCNILDIKKGYEEFLKEKNIQEIVILQKCNCTEICVWGDYDLEDTIKRWKKVASNSSGFDM